MKISSKYNSNLNFSGDKYDKECSLTSLVKSCLMRSIRRRARIYYQVRTDGPDCNPVIIGGKESQTLGRCVYAPEMLCEDLLLNRKLSQVPPERNALEYRYGAMRFALLHLAKSISHVNYNDKQCA